MRAPAQAKVCLPVKLLARGRPKHDPDPYTEQWADPLVQGHTITILKFICTERYKPSWAFHKATELFWLPPNRL